MAVYKIFPTKDATIYSLFPSMNTGLDEIIEATLTAFSYSNPNPQASRFLIQFSETEIDDIIQNKIGISSSVQLLNNNLWKANLQCFVATVTGLQGDTTIECYPIYGTWDMGTGRYLDDPISTNGTSWYWQNYSGSNLWPTTFNALPNRTGSYTGSGTLNVDNPYAGGGVWWTGSNQNWFDSNNKGTGSAPNQH